MPLTNESCPATKKGCFARNLDPIFFIKKKSQSSGLSRELCRTILSAPSNTPGGFLSILLHFFLPFPAQQFQPWECSNNPEHLKLGEREEGRLKSAFQPSPICDKQQEERDLPGDCSCSCIFRGKEEPALAGQPCSQSSITCALLSLTLSTPLPQLRALKEYWAGVEGVSSTKRDADVEPWIPGWMSQDRECQPAHGAPSGRAPHGPELVSSQTILWKQHSLNRPLFITGSKRWGEEYQMYSRPDAKATIL